MSMGKIDQAAEHFILQMRNHFFGETSDQRKSGGSTLVLVVALFERMKCDHKANKAKKRFEKWFEYKSAMQKGLANHTLALDIDGKGVCNEAIEELLLAASVTTMVTAAG